jgi:hypothetical protein
MFYPQKLQVGFEISMHVKKKKKKNVDEYFGSLGLVVSKHEIPIVFK